MVVQTQLSLHSLQPIRQRFRRRAELLKRFERQKLFEIKCFNQVKLVSDGTTLLELEVHLEADVVEEVDDLLVVSFAFDLLRLHPSCDLVQRLREVGHLAHPLEFAEAVEDLGLDLAPLGAVVQQQELDLAHQLLLSLVDGVLLHLEGAFDIFQE